MRCADYLEALVELAQGKPHADAEAHVTTCSACARRLTEYRTLLSVASLRLEQPLPEVVDRAKAIMPVRDRTWAVRIPMPYGLAGARRGTGDAFQQSFQAEGISVRVQYTKLDAGWNLMGKVDAEGTVVWIGDVELGSSFEHQVASLEDSGFTIVLQDREIEVPAGEIPDGHAD